MIKKIYLSIKYIFYGLMVFILIVSSIFLFKGLVIKEDPINMFGFSFFTVGSGSMEPDIMVGDLIVIKKRDNDYYQIGMDVTYLTSEMKTPVTHRIVNRLGDMITTQGIANEPVDKEFHVSNILGEVIFVWKEYYKFSEFVKKPMGIISIILGGLIIIETFGILDKKILVDKTIKDNKEQTLDTKSETVEEKK